MLNSSSLNSGSLNSGSLILHSAHSRAFGPEWLLRFGKPDAPGEINTFYSYKGGTGRTMALANCAGLMAEHWPANVKPILLIDFDLEAPGLHHYLRDHIPLTANPDDQLGTLELFEALKRQVQAAIRADDSSMVCLDDEACNKLIGEFDFTPYLVRTALSPIWLIKAGRFDRSYAKRLSRMRWQNLFKAAPGIFRALAARWAQDYACTMIDARTGLSDTSGICTMLLPDVLTMVFTPNRQSLAGVNHMVRQAQAYRAKSADLRPLRIYPLPSRVEQTSEDSRETWRRGATQHSTFGPVEGYQPLFEQIFRDNFSESDCDVSEERGLSDYFDSVQVPHSPDYAYGERLCFGQHVTKDRLSLRSAFEAFLPWMTSGAQPWESPHVSLDELYLSQWLEALTPPEDNDPHAFNVWLDQIKTATEGAATAGYAVLRDALPSLGNQATAPTALAPLLPQGVLIKAIALMHGEEWDAASSLFTLAIDNAKAHGLPADWEAIPRRWLAYQRANKPLAYLQPWLKTACNTSMENWVDAAHLCRNERWQWMASMVELLGELKVMVDKRRELAADLFTQQQTVLGSEHATTLISMNNFAFTLHAIGELPAARAMGEQLLAIRQRVQGPEDSDTLICMNNLAGTLGDMGDLPAARALHEEVLAIRRRKLGPEDSGTLTSMNNLAETLRAMGDLRGALAMQEQVLEINQRVLGPEHSSTINCLNNLAATLRHVGELPAARAMQEQVLEICRSSRGSEHPDTLTALNNLAGTLSSMGELHDARAMQEQVLVIRQRVLGLEHPETLTSLGNLALTLRAMGDLSKARIMQEQMLEVCQRILGPEHVDTLAATGNLASTLADLGDFPVARAMQEQVLEICCRVLGPEHPDTLTIMNNFAETLHAGGEPLAARAMLEQVLEISRRVLGAEHPSTLTSMNNLAGILRKTSELPAARAIHEQVLDIRRRVLGSEHPATLTSLNNLATTLYAIGDLSDARALQEQVLTTRQSVLGAEHPGTLSSMNNLAFTLHAMGELHDARAMQEQVLEIRHRVLSSDHPNTLSSFSNLLQASQKAGDSAAVSDLLDRYPDLANAIFQKSSAPSTQSDIG